MAHIVSKHGWTPSESLKMFCDWLVNGDETTQVLHKMHSRTKDLKI